jgi:hypothetical protein
MTRRSARALFIAAMALAPAFGCEAPHRPTACAAAPEYKPTTYYGDLTAQISLASVKLPGVRLQIQDSPGGKLLSILQGGETESECVLVVDGEKIADAGVCQEVTDRSGKTLTFVTGGTCGGCRDLAPQVSVTVEGKVEGLDAADPTKAVPARWTFTGTKLPPEQ